MRFKEVGWPTHWVGVWLESKVCTCKSAGAKETARMLIKHKANINVIAPWLKTYSFVVSAI